MSTIWISVLALTAAISQDPAISGKTPLAAPTVSGTREAVPVTADDSADASAERCENLRRRTGRELLDAVRETLARLARPEDEQLEAAVEEFLFVHQELRDDSEMAASQREYYRAKVESRLQQLSIQLKKRISRNKRLAKTKPPQAIRRIEDVPGQLAQRQAGGGAAALPAAGGGMMDSRGRLPADDYGQQLVELIQKTIAPSTWDVNGGLGTIYYWRPGRALVVRQTGEVHERMGGALEQLRRAGP